VSVREAIDSSAAALLGKASLELRGACFYHPSSLYSISLSLIRVLRRGVCVQPAASRHRQSVTAGRSLFGHSRQPDAGDWRQCRAAPYARGDLSGSRYAYGLWLCREQWSDDVVGWQTR
jgi:hypothetical protein